MNKSLRTGAVLLIMCSAVAMCVTARGDDHVIRPQCWDENVNGTVQHHCQVLRNDAAPAPRAAEQAPPPAPPQAAGHPPYFVSPYPVRPWPTTACLYGPPPCPVYYDRWPAPAYGPQPPPYYVPPPGFYPYTPPYYGPGFRFGFGPFSIWIP